MMSPVTIPEASGPRPFSFLIGELKIYYTSHVNKSKNQTKLKKKLNHNDSNTKNQQQPFDEERKLRQNLGSKSGFLLLFDAKGTELLVIQVRVQHLTKTHSRLRVTFVPEYSLCSLEATISFVVSLGFINSNLAESIHPLLVPWTGNTTVKIF